MSRLSNADQAIVQTTLIDAAARYADGEITFPAYLYEELKQALGLEFEAEYLGGYEITQDKGAGESAGRWVVISVRGLKGWRFEIEEDAQTECDRLNATPGISGEAQPLRERAIAIAKAIFEKNSRLTISSSRISSGVRFLHMSEDEIVQAIQPLLSLTPPESPHVAPGINGVDWHSWYVKIETFLLAWRKVIGKPAKTPTHAIDHLVVLNAHYRMKEKELPPESPGPRCPKCGSDDLGFWPYVGQIACNKCSAVIGKSHRPYPGLGMFPLADFAQFFAAPSTRTADGSLRVQGILHNVKARVEAVEHMSFPARPHKCEYTDKERWDLVLGELRWIVRMFEQLKAATPQPAARKPDGYAYRYPSVWDGSKSTVLVFGTNGEEANGSKPIEAIPYFLGNPPQPAAQDSEKLAGKIAESAVDILLSWREDFGSKRRTAAIRELTPHVLRELTAPASPPSQEPKV